MIHVISQTRNIRVSLVLDQIILHYLIVPYEVKNCPASNSAEC